MLSDPCKTALFSSTSFSPEIAAGPAAGPMPDLAAAPQAASGYSMGPTHGLLPETLAPANGHAPELFATDTDIAAVANESSYLLLPGSNTPIMAPPVRQSKVDLIIQQLPFKKKMLFWVFLGSGMAGLMAGSQVLGYYLNNKYEPSKKTGHSGSTQAEWFMFAGWILSVLLPAIFGRLVMALVPYFCSTGANRELPIGSTIQEIAPEEESSWLSACGQWLPGCGRSALNSAESYSSMSADAEEEEVTPRSYWHRWLSCCKKSEPVELGNVVAHVTALTQM